MTIASDVFVLSCVLSGTTTNESAEIDPTVEKFGTLWNHVVHLISDNLTLDLQCI